MRLAVLTEKPFVPRNAALYVQQAFPGMELDFLVCWPFGLYAPPMPRGLAWRDYPHIAPFDSDRFTWRKHTSFPEPLAGRLAPDGTLRLVASRSTFAERLRDADGVLALLEPGSQVYHADVVLRQIRGHGLVRGWTRFLYSFEPTALKTAVSGQQAHEDALAARLVAHGEVRHYFDHQFSVNSVAVLAKTLGESAWISKYQIQTLFLIARHGSLSEAQVLQRMHHWTGTGRYPREGSASDLGLGSARSRHVIVDQMVARGWLDRHAVIGEKPMWQVTLSSRGALVLLKLHPGCEDADLPFRLHAWAEEGLAASRPAMDRYIRTFFGRQKRFAAQYASKKPAP